MKLTIYGLKTCDTCRKALKHLAERDHEVTFCDVRVDGVPDAVLEQALAELGEKRLVNTRSTSWRALSDAEKQAAPLVVLQNHPTVMKRPLIVAVGWMSVGWDVAVITGLEDSLEAGSGVA